MTLDILPRTTEIRAMPSNRIQELIAQFTRDLEAAIREEALESLRVTLTSALGGQKSSAKAVVASKAKPKQASKPAAKKPAANGPRNRRSPAEIEAAAHKILAYVKSHPGAGAEAIKKSTGVTGSEWLAPVQRLLQSKQLVASGSRRSTTYRAT